MVESKLGQAGPTRKSNLGWKSQWRISIRKETQKIIGDVWDLWFGMLVRWTLWTSWRKRLSLLLSSMVLKHSSLPNTLYYCTVTVPPISTGHEETASKKKMIPIKVISDNSLLSFAVRKQKWKKCFHSERFFIQINCMRKRNAGWEKDSSIKQLLANRDTNQLSATQTNNYNWHTRNLI